MEFDGSLVRIFEKFINISINIVKFMRLYTYETALFYIFLYFFMYLFNYSSGLDIKKSQIGRYCKKKT